MSSPLVSVIVAVRNGERFLGSALASIEAQDHRPIEVLVVDGRSTDRTVEIAGSFPDVRVVTQRGRGVADAYNTGVAEARGPLVAFLSHDDLWAPGKLACQVEHLAEHPEVMLTVGLVRFFLEPGCVCPRGFRPELLEGEHVGRIMETLVGRREAFERVGPFDPGLPFGEDVDWFARAADLGLPLSVIPRLLLSKRVHGANLSIDPDRSGRILLDLMRRSIARKRGRTGT